MKKEITLKINGKPLVFDMTMELHNKYSDEFMPNKKVGPSRNLLVRAVRGEYKADLVETLDTVPGAVIHLAQELIEQFMPDLEVTAGE